ncbi:MAG: aminopeptidase P N-terminal domain-containing protein [Proteobacteria bacterium]|nr:aminopeptidase P N-terminal domain-containing protein [Pseudomonadota bacterium]MCL2308162.1 aminopeptidase P N-terminal domain-containing protein [Pseudomonadota bacterium]
MKHARAPKTPDGLHYRARRERLLQTMHETYGGGLVLMPTAPELFRNRDTLYPYRSESCFHYLSGFPEPEAVLALSCDRAGETRHILFCREKNLERETWDGFRFGPDAAREMFSFDEAFPISALEEQWPTLAMNQPALLTPLGLYPDWDRTITQRMGSLRAQARAGNAPPACIVDVRDALDPMRMFKDEHEIALMRHAAAITAQAHVRAMRFAKPDHFEYQIEAELQHEFLMHGTQAAYPSVVASGENACVLHYVSNRRRINAGDLLLIDAGCEYQNYAADVTRTFPVGRRFSAAQKDIYELVLAAQRACFDALKPGAPFHAFHEAAERVLAQGMIDLKLIKGPLDAALETGSFKRFYMHRAGHWLGLDVHDAGHYRRGERGETPTLLEPGMTLTVEPGCYIRADEDIPAAFHNIGVRIEDDVLITKDGIDILTATAPKSVAEVEALCAENP